MGNRAVITFTNTDKSPSIYLHWNGGRASVEGFLAAARGLELSGKTDTERMDNFAAMIARWMGVQVNRSTVYRQPFGRADSDNGDNGTYLITRGWVCIGRMYAPKEEELNASKAIAIADECIAAASVAPVERHA